MSTQDTFIRPSVLAFATQMEKTLRKHDAKKGGQPNWRKDSLESLIARVSVEFGEVLDANANRRLCDVADELVDVANMAMMAYDVTAGLDDDPPQEPQP